MYEVLRVPHSESSFIKAYDIMKAYCGKAFKISFEDFYKRVKSIYMLAEDCGYIGVGYLSHAIYDKRNLPESFRKYETYMYTLDIITFSDDGLYMKLYDLINTIIRDSNDKIIMVQNIPRNNKDLLNALKNNKFKRHAMYPVNPTEYTYTYYHLPINIPYKDEDMLRHIDPKDDLDTIDKMIDFCCHKHDTRIAEAQEKYTAEMILQNLKEIDKNNRCFKGEFIGDTEESFLAEDDCCHPCCRGLSEPIIYHDCNCVKPDNFNIENMANSRVSTAINELITYDDDLTIASEILNNVNSRPYGKITESDV